MDFLKKIKSFFAGKEEKEKAHVMSKNILREYDIRGVFNKNLFTEDALDIGFAFGTLLKRKGLKTVCVGWDCRLSSEELSSELVRGLVKAGAEVISLGICHTPMMYYANNQLNTDAGIMVTGSHNPPEFNGFKIVLGKDPFYGEDIQNLGEMISKRDFEEGNGREIIINNIFKQYIDALHADMTFSDDLKIAWDIGNGATSRAVKVITSIIPGHHHLINEEMDGNFPNRSPDPIAPGSVDYLAKFVTYNKFDIGFAFDSDGDRVCIVNNKGEVLFSDQVLEVFARNFLKKNPAAQVIAGANCCNHLFDTIRECGGIALIEKAGHSNIKARMKSSGALLAGEMSGHFFFKDRWFGFDDGIYAALRCLEIIGEDKNAFSNFHKSIITPEIRIPCADDKKFKVIEEIKDKLQAKNINFSTIDGVRVNSDSGWWMLRASNTQEVLSCRIEASTEEEMVNTKSIIVNFLKDYVSNIEDILKDK